MKLDDILKLMEAAQSTDFDVVELEDEEFYIKLERNRAPHVVAQAVPAQAAMAEPAPQAEEAAPEKQGGHIPDAHDITSPLVGIFHERSGSPVRIGDKIKKGEVVCLVEAMKLMNEIQMPEDGEIAWIAVEEGSTVEFEQILYRYTK